MSDPMFEKLYARCNNSHCIALSIDLTQQTFTKKQAFLGKQLFYMIKIPSQHSRKGKAKKGEGKGQFGQLVQSDVLFWTYYLLLYLLF